MLVRTIPDDGVNTMLPVPAWMGSVKVSTMSVEAATFTAPSPGLYVEISGASVSATVNWYVLPSMPANGMSDASLNTPDAMVTV